jgi:hypothetical protein
MKALIYSIFLIVLCQSCAQTGTLVGGDKDTTPPQLDSLRSTPNRQLRFAKQPITLAFDEWIKLEDISKQVIVSPPLRETPEVKLRGKSVIFTFSDKEILRENATYTINFGSAIKDITEGNKAEIRFVFSTGDQLDSLRVRGRIVNTITGEPVDNALFMLYDNVADSAFHKERPFYFAKSDKTGFATIENVRKGTYRMVSLSDLNANYLFDLPTELVGFHPNLIQIGDTTKQLFSIQHFEEKLSLKIKNKETNRYGQLKIAYNQPLEKLLISAFPKPNDLQCFVQDDTLRVWYEGAADRWTLVANKDSIEVRTPNKEAFLKTQNLQINGFAKAKKGQAPLLSNAIAGQTYSIETSVPTAAQNIQFIRFQEDTLSKFLNIKITKDSLNPRKLWIGAPLESDKKYRITVLPNALTDIFGKPNKDTLTQQLNVLSKASLGSVSLSLKNLDRKKSYIIQLRSKEGVLAEEKIVSSLDSTKLVFKSLTPSEYKVQIIIDENKNKRWDTGDYDKHQQPELIIMKPIEQAVRADWEVEALIEL